MTAEKLEQIRRQNMEHCGFGPAVMQRLKVCTVCGSPAASQRHFCTECGRRLPDRTLYDLYKERHAVCAACSAVLAADMNFCPRCGAKTPTDRQ